MKYALRVFSLVIVGACNTQPLDVDAAANTTFSSPLPAASAAEDPCAELVDSILETLNDDACFSSFDCAQMEVPQAIDATCTAAIPPRNIDALSLLLDDFRGRCEKHSEAPCLTPPTKVACINKHCTLER